MIIPVLLQTVLMLGFHRKGPPATNNPLNHLCDQHLKAVLPKQLLERQVRRTRLHQLPEHSLLCYDPLIHIAPSVPSSLPAENSKQPSKRSGQTNQTGSQELARLLNEDSEDEDQDFQPQTAHDSDVDMFTESLDSSDDDTRNPQPTFTELTPVQTPTSVTSVLMTPPQLVTPTQAKTGRPSASTPSQKVAFHMFSLS